MPAERDDFIAQAHRWKPFYSTCIKNVLAVRSTKSKKDFQLVYGVTAFFAEPPAQFEPLDVQTNSIRASRQVSALTSSEAIQAVDEAIANPGRIEIENVLEAELSGNPGFINFEYDRLYPSQFPGPRRIPTLTAQTRAWLQGPDLETLNQELLTNGTPYDGLGDLWTAVGIPFPITGVFEEGLFKHCRVQTILMPPAFIDERNSTLESGKLAFTISKHADISVDRLRVGLKYFPISGGVKRETRNVLSQETCESTNKVKVEYKVGPTALVVITLALDGDLLERFIVRDIGATFNQRLRLHRAADPKEVFKSTFFDTRNDFEDRVTLLLALLGLSPLKYGEIAELTDAPDILAISTEGHLFVIDCTTGDVNQKGKLYRLYERTKRIRESLYESPEPPLAVVPVIITSLNRVETAAHFEQGKTFQISFVCKEEILGLLERLDAPPTPSELYKAALSLIPDPAASATGAVG